MISRFVVVPAIPTETGSTRDGMRFYCETAPSVSTSMTTKKKHRLKTTYQIREEVRDECQRLNHKQLLEVLTERQSMTVV